MSNFKFNYSISTITKTKKKILYLFFFLVMVPVFINLDISEGLRFDVNAINKLNKPPSLPLSFFIMLLFIFNFKVLLKKKDYVLFFFITFFISSLSVFIGNFRIIIIFVQMNFFLIYFYIFQDFFKNYDKYIILDFYFKSLSLIIFIKFCFDFFLFQNLDTNFFLNKSLLIYNYYDYFPFIYFLAGTLSLRNIWYKKNFLISLIILIICLISLIFTHSRLFSYSFYLVPFLILFYQIIKLNKKSITILYFLIVILLTFIFASNPNLSSEESMVSRFDHWKFFFESFDAIHILFPFTNKYRIAIDHGSFHNELLEIFSYFGLFSLLFFFQLYKIFTKPTINGYSMITKLLLFVFIIGMLVQNNFLNIYISVLLASFLSLTQLEIKKK